MDKLRALFLKYREIISYLFFGGLTTVVSWVAYALFVGAFHTGVNVGNLLSWICAVTFAFVTNKLWVFQSKGWQWPKWVKEAAAFYAGRVFSGLVELGGLPLLMKLGLDQSVFGVDGLVAKVVVSVVVIILNYFLSKFFAFKTPKDP